MFKKLFFFIFIIITIFVTKSKQLNISHVFKNLEDKTVELDNQYKEYHLYYDNENLTTNNILNELAFLKNENNIKVVIIVDIDNEIIEYSIDSNNLKKNLGEFFNHCISILESKYLDNEIVKAYSSGIKIKELIITMPKVLANNYLQYKNDLYYEIK